MLKSMFLMRKFIWLFYNLASRWIHDILAIPNESIPILSRMHPAPISIRIRRILSFLIDLDNSLILKLNLVGWSLTSVCIVQISKTSGYNLWIAPLNHIRNIDAGWLHLNSIAGGCIGGRALQGYYWWLLGCVWFYVYCFARVAVVCNTKLHLMHSLQCLLVCFQSIFGLDAA